MPKIKKDFKNPAIKYAVSVVIGLLAFIIINLIFAFIIVKTPYPKENSLIFALISICVSSFVSAFIFVFKERKNGLVSGLIIGFIYAVLMFLTYAFFSSFSLSQNSLLIIPACLLPSSIAGILAVNIRHK